MTDLRYLWPGTDAIHITLICEDCEACDVICEESLTLCSTEAALKGWVGSLCKNCAENRVRKTGKDVDG
jgi:hypothetical protein